VFISAFAQQVSFGPQHWDCKLRDFHNLATDRFVALDGWNVLKWIDRLPITITAMELQSEIVLYRDISQ